MPFLIDHPSYLEIHSTNYRGPVLHEEINLLDMQPISKVKSEMLIQ